MLAPHLAHLSLTMLRNRCCCDGPCDHCRRVDWLLKEEKRGPPAEAVGEAVRNEWLAQAEMELERSVRPEEMHSSVHLDEQAVSILAAANRLKHLNFYGWVSTSRGENPSFSIPCLRVSFTSPAAERSFSQLVGPRIESLVIGELSSYYTIQQNGGVSTDEFLSGFTQLRCLVLYGGETPTYRVPLTLVRLELMITRLDIDDRLVQYLSHCPLLQSLAMKVGAAINGHCLNAICGKFHRYAEGQLLSDI